MGKRILFLVLSDGVELASATSGETKLGNTVASQGGGSNCKLLELQETGDPNPTWRAHTVIIVLFVFILCFQSASAISASPASGLFGHPNCWPNGNSRQPVQIGRETTILQLFLVYLWPKETQDELLSSNMKFKDTG